MDGLFVGSQVGDVVTINFGQFGGVFWHEPSSSTEYSLGNEVEREIVRPNYKGSVQGMLVHPLTGTGLSGDPMIPEQRRKDAISRALSLGDVAEYKRSLGSTVRSQKAIKVDYLKDEEGNPVIESAKLLRSDEPYYKNPEGAGWPQTQDPNNPGRVLRQAFKKTHTAKISDTQAVKHMGMISESVYDTDIPTHVLEGIKKPITAILDPQKGRAWADGYGGTIRLTMPGNVARQHTVHETVLKTPASETPMHNPKFWKSLDKVWGDDHDPVTANEVMDAATHWVNPETGDVLSGSELSSQAHKDDSHHKILESLKTQGYYPNLFEGKGNLSSKSHAVGKSHKLETGYSSREYTDDPYTYTHYHTRFQPDTSKTPEEVKISKVVRPEIKLSKTTTLHEMGHAMDPNLEDNFSNMSMLKSGADPLKEGIADATADRYVRYKGQFEDTLANIPNRLDDFARTGYSTLYSGWENKLHKAIYVASRYHAALSDNNIETLPSREKLIKAHYRNVLGMRPPSGRPSSDDFRADSNLANTLALGQMYDRFSHVRGILAQAGFEDVAKKAHQTYLKSTRGDKRGATQEALPGMEKFV